jgi:hypothetical protein
MMDCDRVDVEVGEIQCGPYHCDNCGASEIGHEAMELGFEATDEEQKTGYYRGRHSPYANTVQGTLVDHKTAKRLYEFGLLDEKPKGDDFAAIVTAVLDRHRLAAEFEVAESTVDRWANGIAKPHPRVQEQIIATIRRWETE